jgi:hypothetical protein
MALRVKVPTLALVFVVFAVGVANASAHTDGAFSTGASTDALRGAAGASVAPVQSGGVAVGGATRVVRYGGLQLVVPASWPVYQLASHPTTCVRFDRHAVYLGRPGADQRCPAHAVGRTAAILVEPLSEHLAQADGAAGPALRPATTPAAQSPRAASAEFVPSGKQVLVTATWSGQPGPIARALGVRSLPGASAGSPPSGVSSPGTGADAGEAVDPAGPVVARPAMARAGFWQPLAHAAGVYTGLGFDACSTPSAAALSAWTGSPYRAVGIYIGGANVACSQSNLTAAWVRAQTAAGWRLIPTYVGLQAPGNSCGCAAISPSHASAEGAAAATDAVNQARSLALGQGNPIYYDMEAYRRGAATGTVLAFLSAWTSTLHADGYVSGVYSSARSGIVDFVDALGSGFAEPDDLWVADWNDARTTSDPYVPIGDWSDHQRLHQLDGGRNLTYGGVRLNVDDDYLDGATAGADDVLPPALTNGTFVQVADQPAVYRIAGGAPMLVEDWNSVGGPQPVTVISQQQFDALGPVPADGTFLETSTGAVYRVAGGAPLWVSNWSGFGGPQPSVVIDNWDLENLSNPAARLNAVPANGTFVVTAAGEIFRFAGGAPFAISSWAVYGTPKPAVMIDRWDIVNLGGALVNMNSAPADGTIVEGLLSGTYWLFTGGLRSPTAPTPAAVKVDDVGLAAYPTVPGVPGGIPSAPPVSCVVPALSQLTVNQADQTLVQAHCTLGEVRRPRRLAANHVLRVSAQSAPPRTRHVAGFAVDVQVT